MGNPLRFLFFEFYNFELREFWQQDFGSWGCGLIWLMFYEEALTPSDMIPMCDLFWGRIPCKFLFCSFHVGTGRRFRWHEASVWVIKPAQALYPSDMPMSEPIQRGNPLQFFLHFAIWNWEDFDKRIRDSQEVAVGPVDVPKEEMCTTFA